ncbi:hypothetical protein SS1G_11699 [Sclerotinia sclerotiorum 1980 UF-70]|uniref:Uncharacterized protein n=1 Tax=Sclerotinia sclerotiorum (strain ATCC 18683 / 1980 / Ss-1) TaxID=665079 RepID=A7F278_SCLS1|nr:hypothetical protein SS1G_11699 [Sclerotinia sclerotiorum 1980 UF-70]EDN95820.1 hypothetical protein SS1G_11699 [Sclerotinia sclerotiorum 1980 UF-70]
MVQRPKQALAMAYFFCQSTVDTINSAISVLFGLTYMLLDEQPFLIRYLQKEYEVPGKQLFKGINALSTYYALQAGASNRTGDPLGRNHSALWLLSGPPELSAYVHDAKRFALRNRVGIEQAPLRIYCCWYEKDTEDVAPTDYDTTGKSLQIFEGHSDWVNSVAFSPDKKVIVSGSDDGTIRFWDITTGKSLQVFEDHSGEVNSVAFSPDGKMSHHVTDSKRSS